MSDVESLAAGSPLRLLFEAGTVTGVSDRQLLERFATRRDELAFTALVERHGPMVQRVCRAALGDHHDAQDAVQATFLVLARSAGSIRRGDSLASWLYGVALRVASRARASSARRRRHEQSCAALRPVAVEAHGGPNRDDLEALLHQEIGRLPERFRAPLVLCHLEGRTYEEAAQVLVCPVGTIKSRLSTARQRLRRRLERFDPTVFSGSVALAIRESPSPTIVPAMLPASTLSAVVRHAVGGPAPAAIARLAEGVLAAMLRHRLPGRVAAAAALLIGTAALAAGAIALAPARRLPGPAPVPGPGPRARPQAGPPAKDIADADADPLPAGATLRFGTTRYRHSSTIENLAVSPDGRIVVVNSGTRNHSTLRSYDLATGRALVEFDRSGSSVGVAISPDGKTVAIATLSNSSLHFRDLATGAETAEMRLPAANQGAITDLILYCPDGKHLVVRAPDGKMMLLIDPAKREVVRTFAGAGTIFAGALSSDGKTLVAGGFDYQDGRGWFARRWNVATGRELGPITLGKGGIRSVAISPDGKILAIGGETRKPAPIVLVDAATGKELRTIAFAGSKIVRTLTFSPDGKTLAASGGWTTRIFDGTTRLFDTATGEELRKLDYQGIGLHFTADGGTLIGAVGGAIYRWDVVTGRTLIPEGGDSMVNQIAATPDGSRIVTRGDDGDAHVWDARTGQHQRRLTVSFQRGLALSPDGRFLVWPESDESIEFRDADDARITHYGSRLRMVNITTGAAAERFGGFDGEGHDVYFTDGGKTLVTADHYRRDANIRVWDVATGRLARSYPAQGPYRIWRTRLSPDGKSLAVLHIEQPVSFAVGRQLVKLWDLASGKELDEQPHRWFDDEVVAYSRDGKTAAVVASGGMIQLRDAATWDVRGELRGPGERPTAIALGPDGRLYTGSTDGTVLAWDTRSVKPPTRPEPAEPDRLPQFVDPIRPR